MATSFSPPERWLEAHADALYRYAATRLPRPADAEDAVQDTLLAALGSARSFRGDSAERTWLIGILKHKVADQLRVAERRSSSKETEEEDVDDCEDLFTKAGRWRQPPAALAYDEQDLLENEEFWTQFRRCQDGLPPRQARVFALHTLGENEPEETCKLLDISTTNLWVLLHRARLKLRACLEANWFRSEGRR